MKLTYSLSYTVPETKWRADVSTEIEIADLSTLKPTIERVERTLAESCHLNYEKLENNVQSLENQERRLLSTIKSLKADITEYQKKIQIIKDCIQQLGLDPEKLDEIPF